MRINIEEDGSLREIEVILRCRRADEQVASIVASLQMHDLRIPATADGTMIPLLAKDVLYIESVDGTAFAYTPDAVFEVRLRLSELEERLEPIGFVRIAKNCIVDLCRIQSLRPSVGARLLAMMDNGEEIVVSRRYASKLKELLGVEKGA